MFNPLDYLLSVVYMIYFLLCLCVFHVVQVVAFNVFGVSAHRKSVEILNFFLLYGSCMMGTRLTFTQKEALPTNRPMIFAANHQSMFDIIGMIWFLRKYKPIFISKKELSKGIPSISYNLQKSHAALIDRKDSRQAVGEIIRLAEYVKGNVDFSIAIFPEGTRSRTKELKEFHVGGIATVLKKIPDALIVPVAIEGVNGFNPKGFFPVKCFQKLSWTILKPIEAKGLSAEEAINEAKRQIQEYVKK